METTIVYWGYIGMMEKKMETTIMDLYRDCMVYILGIYRGYTGIMEKKMEITIMGLYRDYGGQRCRLQELRMETTTTGSIGIIWGIYWVYIYRGYIGIMEKKMEATV